MRGNLEFSASRTRCLMTWESPLRERSVCDIIKKSSPVCAQTERRERCRAGEELHLAVSLTGRFFSVTAGPSPSSCVSPRRGCESAVANLPACLLGASLGETRLRDYGASTTSWPARVLRSCNCSSGRSSAINRTEPSARAKLAPPGWPLPNAQARSSKLERSPLGGMR